MTISARILADSVHYLGEKPSRLTTFELRYPRMIHAEIMTHRMLSRNASSSRAIPIEKMIADVLTDPAMFVFWGRNQKGMQAAEEMSPDEVEVAKVAWLEARDRAVEQAQKLLKLGLHKQNVNRLLEPWMHITIICTATDWANFYFLRRSPMAQPEFKALADAMWREHQVSMPVDRTNLDGISAWHLPFVGDEERVELGEDALKVCAGRCARVSYLTHNGKRDPAADIELHDRLATSGHWSPFEHPAKPLLWGERLGNFVGWLQYRKTLTGEHPYEPGQVEP